MNRVDSAMRGFCVRLMTLIALAFLLTPAAIAQLPAKRDNAISISLLPEGRIVQAGTKMTLAFVMKPNLGWHGYWQNPGDAGTEPRIEWQLPKGVKAGPLLYPVPGRLTISGLMNYVYEREYALLAGIGIPAGLASGTKLSLRARLDYLACTDRICVPESAAVETELVVGTASRENKAAIDRFRQALPRPLGAEGRFEVKGGRLRIAIPIPSTAQLGETYLYPLTDGALEYSAVQTFFREGDLLIVETRAGKGAESLGRLDALLEYAGGQGLQFTANPGAVPAGTLIPKAHGDPQPARTSWLSALFAAILGGLILNIMPCVFPILSLKALSLAKAGGDERTARREALAYSAGVILVCLALGAVLLAVRAGGASVGWAFQLQDPRVILLLLLLVTAIALNLAGLFELPAITGGEKLARSGGTSGAFWTGALAAFIATPCTGPFMGVALGAALILPAPAALAVFAGLGLGLALPFLSLGFVPALRSRLPRPGPWMSVFRHILALPMLLTALGLAWILQRQSGTEGLLLGLGAALVLASCLWWIGRKGGRARLMLLPAAAAALAAILLVPANAPVAARAQSSLPSEPFSEQRLAELRAEGRPVFVYFTADWCLTCKVNEKGVLDRSDVAASFAEKNVAVLVGDWTKGDAAIGRFLERNGRSGVPLYLYYAPGKPPEILPQILTAGRLTGLR